MYHQYSAEAICPVWTPNNTNFIAVSMTILYLLNFQINAKRLSCSLHLPSMAEIILCSKNIWYHCILTQKKQNLCNINGKISTMLATDLLEMNFDISGKFMSHIITLYLL